MIARWAQMMLAIWTVFAPFALGFAGPGADWATANDVVVGLLVVVIAVAGMGGGMVRMAAFPLGLWLVIAPEVIGVVDPRARWNDWAVGIAIALLSLVPSRQFPVERTA